MDVDIGFLPTSAELEQIDWSLVDPIDPTINTLIDETLGLMTSADVNAEVTTIFR